MTDIEDLDPQRRELLEKKLGPLLSWKVPDLVQTVGPFDLTPYQTYDAERRRVVGACASRLMEFADEDVDRMLHSLPEERRELSENWTSYLSREVSKLRKLEPSWYAGGFGHPRTRADVAYWSKMAHFSVNEIICLSVGIEPSSTLFRFLDQKTNRASGDLLPAFVYLGRRREQFTRKFGVHHEDRVVWPTAFLDWVDAVQIEVDDAFLAELRKTCQKAAGGKAPHAAPAPDKREIDKVAQILTIMAIDHLGFQPHTDRSPIPKEIAEIAEANGIQVSQDTVRKYLRIGAKFIPTDRKPE